MATTEQLARQLQRELDARSEAIKRLRERTRNAEDRCYASSTVYGSAFINKGLELITEEISSKLTKITAGHAAEYAQEIQAVTKCDPGVLALITAKSTLDVWKEFLNAHNCMCLIVGHDLTRSPAGTDKFPTRVSHFLFG